LFIYKHLEVSCMCAWAMEVSCMHAWAWTKVSKTRLHDAG